mgnify:CR=1 FL=1
MSLNEKTTENKFLFERIRAISNPKRFKILLATKDNEVNITDLSKKLNLAYNKCADYVRVLEKLKLIEKKRSGKEAKIRSKVILSENKIEFIS